MMADGHKAFRLRYVGPRFDGARLPIDVLSDLPAFRDLLVSYAKDLWRTRNADRKRLPKGFDGSITFDLTAIERGSAMPMLDWNRETAQRTLPGVIDEVEELVDLSYASLVRLIDGAGHGKYPQSLSSEHVRALNKFGSSLRDDERIEFPDSSGEDGRVVYLDSFRRKKLITHVRDTYQTRFDGVGRLLGSHVDGHVSVRTEQHGDIMISVDSSRVVSEFDGNINATVQFSLQVELDNNDRLKGIIEVFDIEVIDEESADSLIKCRARLKALTALEAGWHDGEGLAVSKGASELADSFLTKRPIHSSAYRIYPTDGGGLLFEFIRCGWDYSLEFNADGSIEMYGIQVDGPDEMEPEVFEQLNESFFGVFDARMNR